MSLLNFLNQLNTPWAFTANLLATDFDANLRSMVREMGKRLWMYRPTTIKALNLCGDERPPTHRAHDFSRGIPMWHFSANDIQPVCYT